jgi:hypothetical protein
VRTYPGELNAATGKMDSAEAYGFLVKVSNFEVAGLNSTGLRSGRYINSLPYGMLIVFATVKGTRNEPAMPTAAYPSNSKISPAALATTAVSNEFILVFLRFIATFSPQSIRKWVHISFVFESLPKGGIPFSVLPPFDLNQ